MNIAASTEKKSSFLITALFLRFLPQKPSGRALLWGSLPALLLLLNVGVGFLQASPLITYLPFVALAAAALALRFKTIGLSVGYAALAGLLLWFLPSSDPAQRFWLMGIFFNIALTLYIAVLTAEEVDVCFDEVRGESEEQHAVAEHIAAEFNQAKKSAAVREYELEEEIRKLKEEAEHRRIERVRENNRFELIHSEIDLLNSQKEEFIVESRVARELAAKLEINNHELKEEAIAAQEEVIKWQQKPATVVIEEKIIEIEKIVEVDKLIEVEKIVPVEKIVEVEKIVTVEKVIEKIVPFETIVEVEKIVEIEKEVVAVDQAALVQAQNQYKQLRGQFNEKSEILSQTRRELFALQGKFEALEKENAFATLNPNRAESLSLEHSLNALTQEVSILEEEVSSLESIISTLLVKK